MAYLTNARIWIYFVMILMAFTVCRTAESAPVFPGAQGFGTDTRAAYGLAPKTNPTVYRVTSLDPSTSTPGTFGYALTRSGPRVIVFEVSGTIDGPAGGIYHYLVDDPYVTVAGQTAPSPGITLKGIRLMIQTHDVLIQHIRFRLGDALKPGEGLSWLQNRDCMSIGNTTSSDAYNVVIDHCSFSWAMDENIEIWNGDGGSVHDITISNSITSEGLYGSVRCDYDPVYANHSKGLLIGYGSANISIIGNLFAHNQDRNPVVYDGTSAVVNNVIYNPGSWGVNAAAAKAPVKVSVVGNVVIRGRNSGSYVDYALSIGAHVYKPWYNDGVGSKVYVTDNGCVNCGTEPWQGVDDRGDLEPIVKRDIAPVWPSGLKPKSSSDILTIVLNNSGARPAARDAVDKRIVSDVTAGTGRWIDSQDEVNGWPSLKVERRSLTLPSALHADVDADGYTNLEEWLHSFAAKVAGTSYIEAPTGLTIVSTNQ